MEFLLNIIYFVIGTIIGSFTNMLSYRYVYSKPIWTKSSSYCPSCQHDLAWYNLVPILSFLFQRGKCSYCYSKINGKYLILELFSGVFFMLIMHNLPLNYVNLAFIFVLLMFLIPILVIDVMIHIIYDGYIKTLIVLTALFIAINQYFYKFDLFLQLPTLKTALICLVVIYVGGILFNKIGGFLLYRDYHFDLMGMGDVKLIAWMCMIFGSYIEIIIVVILASFIGVVLYAGHQLLFHMFVVKSKNVVSLHFSLIDYVSKEKRAMKIRISNIINKKLYDSYISEKVLPYTFLLDHIDSSQNIIRLHTGKLQLNINVSPEVIQKINEDKSKEKEKTIEHYVSCNLIFDDKNMLTGIEYDKLSDYEIYIQSVLRTKSFGIEGLPFAPSLVFAFIVLLIWNVEISAAIRDFFMQ